MTTLTTDHQLVEALQTVAVNGSYNASRALSKWLRRGVRLTSDGFRSVPISEASRAIGDPDEPIAAVRLPLDGDLSGDMLLTFPVATALRVVDIMMQQPEGTATELGELEQSCLQETGNIVSSAYANSLAKWLSLHIEPSVPVFAHDMVCSILDPLLMDVAAQHDEVFFAVTEFVLEKQRLQWGLMLLPSSSSLKLMEAKCRCDGVRRNALRTIAVNGAFNASRAMSKWLKRGVRISTGGFDRTALADVARSFDEGTPIAALHLPLGATIHGHALLAATERNALMLANLLLQQPVGTATQIGELEQSCLSETGNIIASSFVNSWATWLEMTIEPEVPRFVFDHAEAVLDTILSEQALVSDEALLARTEFAVDDQSLEWLFILVPAPSTLRLIEAYCD